MQSGAVTVSQLQVQFGVSPMTARRDTQRMGVAIEAKVRLADAAFAPLRGGETVFLDSSSTAFFLARRIADGSLSLRVITNSGG